MGPALPVDVVRCDKFRSSKHGWVVMDSYVGEWLDEVAGVEDERAVVNRWYPMPSASMCYVHGSNDSYEVVESRPTALLSCEFPMGSVVAALAADYIICLRQFCGEASLGCICIQSGWLLGAISASTRPCGRMCRNVNVCMMRMHVYLQV